MQLFYGSVLRCRHYGSSANRVTPCVMDIFAITLFDSSFSFEKSSKSISKSSSSFLSWRCIEGGIVLSFLFCCGRVVFVILSCLLYGSHNTNILKSARWDLNPHVTSYSFYKV